MRSRTTLSISLFLCLFLAGVLALCTSARGYAQSGVGAPPADTPLRLSLQEYRALLDEIAAQLENASNSDDIVLWLATRLDAVESVAIAPDVLIRPVNLLRNEPTASEALARIETLQTQIDLSATDRLAERQAVVQGVLDQRIYREDFSLWDLVVEWIRRLWNWLFPPDRNPFNTAAGEATLEDIWVFFGRSVAILGGIAIALLLGWWGARFIGGFVRNAELNRRRILDDDMPASAAEARANAASEARSGSYRQAVRSLYLSALLALEEAEIVVHDRSLTNRELLARTAGLAAGEIRPAMQPVVQGFDDIWYGVVEPDAATYAVYESDVAVLNRRIEERVRTPAGNRVTRVAQ